MAAACLSGTVTIVDLARPIHAVDPGGRAAIEATVTLLALFSALLYVAGFRHSRQLPDLMLLYAVVAVSLADFLDYAAPALAGGSGPELGGGARLWCDLAVSCAFAAAAFAPSKEIPDPGRRLVRCAIAAAAGTVMLMELLELATGAHAEATLQEEFVRGAARHPVTLGIDLALAAILLASGLAFLRRARRGELGCALLAGAAFLLTGARLQYLSMPAVAVNWVTPREGLRLAAYSLLLSSAYWQYARTRRAQLDTAISSERERIARDLHDGLAQDLACIAVQGQRLSYELEPEHPLMIAARHALLTSRGVITDLSASTAPSTEAALRLVADDLEHRLGLQIGVRIETSTALIGYADLEPQQREHVVRIAREAIVNAALHGAAGHVEVVLLRKGRDLLMRVSDDGCGIPDTQASGLGLRTMRARAASLGGRLRMRPRAGGGTELELLVP